MRKMKIIVLLFFLISASINTNDQHLFWGVDVLNPDSYKWESVADKLSEEWGVEKEAVIRELSYDYYQLSQPDKSLEEPFITFDAISYYPERSYLFEKAVEDDEERKIIFDELEDYLTNRYGDTIIAFDGLVWSPESPAISYVSLDEVDTLLGLGIDGKGLRVDVVLK